MSAEDVEVNLLIAVALLLEPALHVATKDRKVAAMHAASFSAHSVKCIPVGEVLYTETARRLLSISVLERRGSRQAVHQGHINIYMKRCLCANGRKVGMLTVAPASSYEKSEMQLLAHPAQRTGSGG